MMGFPLRLKTVCVFKCVHFWEESGGNQHSLLRLYGHMYKSDLTRLIGVNFRIYGHFFCWLPLKKKGGGGHKTAKWKKHNRSYFCTLIQQHICRLIVDLRFSDFVNGVTMNLSRADFKLILCYCFWVILFPVIHKHLSRLLASMLPIVATFLSFIDNVPQIKKTRIKNE